MCRLFVQQWKKYNNELGRFVIVFYFNVTKEIDDDKLGTNLAPPGLLGAWTKKENHNEHPLVVIFSWCIKTKQKKRRRASLSLSFLGAPKKKTKKQQQTLIRRRRFLWVHWNKRKKDDSECQFIIIFFGCIGKKNDDKLTHRHFLWVHKNKRRKDDNKPIYHIFSGCK